MRFFLFLIFSFILVQTSIVAQNDWEGRTLLIPYRLGEKWGYSDTLGHVIIEPVYDSVGFFSSDKAPARDDLALVVRNGKQGAIDKTGTSLIDTAFDKITIENIDDYCLLEIDKQQGIATLRGDVIIPATYDRIVFDRVADGFLISRNGKMSWRDRAGRVLAPLEYDRIFTIDQINDSNDQVIGQQGDKTYQLYRDGRRQQITFEERNGGSDYYLLDTPSYRENQTSTKDSLLNIKAAAIKSRLGLTEIDVETFKKDGYFVVKKGEKVGLIRQDEARSIPMVYDSVMALYVPLSAYRMEEGYTYRVYQCAVKKEGECVDLFWVKKNGKVGVVDQDNEVVLPLIYDDFVEDNKFRPILDRKIGEFQFENSMPKMRLECLYDSLEYEHYIYVKGSWIFSIYRVSKDGKWGYAGKNGVEFFKN